MKRDLSGNDHLSKFDKKRPAGYPSDKEIPVVLVLKRKAIRVYPDNQKVVLYYSQALDKYISVPFGPQSDALGPVINEARKPKNKPSDTELDDIIAIKNEKAFRERIKDLHPYYQKIVMARRSKRIQTAGGPKPPIHKLDVIDRTPAKELMDAPGGLRGKAVTTLARVGTGEMSPGEGLMALGGLAARGVYKTATAPIRLAKRALTKEEMEVSRNKTQISESFRQRVKAIREEQEQIDEWIIPAIGVAGRIGSAIAGTRLGRRLMRSAIKNLWNKRKKGGEDTRGSGKGSKMSAMDYARMSGAEASQVKNQQQFQGVDPQVSGPTSTDPNEKRLQRAMAGIPLQGGSEKFVRESFNSNIDAIKYIVENDISSMPVQIGEGTVNLNKRVAKKVLTVYESLNRENKKKVEAMLNESAISFKKVINFAVRQ